MGWTLGTQSYLTRAVVNTMGAAATTSSLYLAKSTTSSYYDGLYQTFASPLAPSSISWYASVPKTPYDYAGIFNLFSTTTTTNLLFRLYFSLNGYIYLSDGTTSASLKVFSINTFYHFELRNINWTNRTFDFYIDGVLTRTGDYFLSTGNSIGRVDLGDYYSGDNAYFDQIDFLP